MDLTQKLALHSKKLDRQQRKDKRRVEKAAARRGQAALHLLPAELLVEIISNLQPSDVFSLVATCKALQDQINLRRELVASLIIAFRYPNISRAFPRPKRIAEVDEKYHQALQSQRRQEMLQIHRKPYQHVQSHDPRKICSCLTCVLLWNNLCLIVDLHHWQDRFDKHEPTPIPHINRGENPDWNIQLVHRNSLIVRRALKDSIWYARILEKHLDTIVRTGRRWRKYPRDPNRPDYRMTEAEAMSGTDSFLGRRGQQSLEFPYRRDTYYHLEAYMPNRKWDHEKATWLYMPATQHDRDCEWALGRHTDLMLPVGYRIRASDRGTEPDQQSMHSQSSRTEVA